MELKDYTTEELRAELKRRYAEEKAKKASILRCRMCKHWGEIGYWGNPIIVNHIYTYRDNRSCRFFKTKNGKYYRCHRASQLACENFERREEQLCDQVKIKGIRYKGHDLVLIADYQVREHAETDGETSNN